MDHLSALPAELCFLVFSFLDDGSWKNALLASRALCTVQTDTIRAQRMDRKYVYCRGDDGFRILRWGEDFFADDPSRLRASILICGPRKSGKSTLANRFVERIVSTGAGVQVFDDFPFCESAIHAPGAGQKVVVTTRLYNIPAYARRKFRLLAIRPAWAMQTEVDLSSVLREWCPDKKFRSLQRLNSMLENIPEWKPYVFLLFDRSLKTLRFVDADPGGSSA